MLLSYGVTASINRDSAKNIITKLDEYQTENGRYPTNLEIIGIDNSKYSYDTDSLQTKFSIMYDTDGWHYSEYSSETKQWVTND